MGFIYTDPNTAGPFASFQMKDVQVKVFKLTSANFTTGNTDAKVGALPGDCSILGFETWVGTALSGNGVTSPVISLGTASAGTQYASAVAITNTVGTAAKLSPVTGIMQAHAVPPASGDTALWVRGGCSTGSPTAGEIYLAVYFIR